MCMRIPEVCLLHLISIQARPMIDDWIKKMTGVPVLGFRIHNPSFVSGGINV